MKLWVRFGIAFITLGVLTLSEAFALTEEYTEYSMGYRGSPPSAACK